MSDKSKTTLDPNKIYQEKRGDGTTTKQIKASPKNAIFVCPNRACVEYSKHLAFDVGRSDIEFVTPALFECHGWLGVKKSRVVIDHATRRSMPPRQREEMDMILETMHD